MKATKDPAKLEQLQAKMARQDALLDALQLRKVDVDTKVEALGLLAKWERRAWVLGLARTAIGYVFSV